MACILEIDDWYDAHLSKHKSSPFCFEVERHLSHQALKAKSRDRSHRCCCDQVGFTRATTSSPWAWTTSGDGARIPAVPFPKCSCRRMPALPKTNRAVDSGGDNGDYR